MITVGGIELPEKTCDMCKNKFHLHDHRSGFVFDDKYFLCEHCSTQLSDEDLHCWTKSVMQDPEVGMPIGLWLIHEQNKDKPIFTRQKH